MTTLPTRRLFSALGLILAALGLGACLTTVGPDYAPPKAPAPDAWHARLPDGLTSQTASAETLARWWETFNDPVLTALVHDAIAGNLDLQTALSSVRQARAQAAITRSSLYPTLDASGSATHQYSRTESKASAAAGGGTVLTKTEANVYRAGFDASWELDMFGGLRRDLEASLRDMQAQEASFYDVLVSLTAEVATNYVTARAYQTRIDLAEKNLAMQKETLDLVESKFTAELIDELPVQQARYTYENTAAQIPTLRAGLEEALNRLAVLLGQTPGAVHERLNAHRPIPTPPAAVAVGVPSDALRRRPDLRQAEMELAAQTARIGVAVAELYPKFYLTGSLSRQGEGTLGFRNYATDALSFGPSVSWRLLDAGAIRQNINVQTEKQKQALLAYRSAVLSALEEADNKIYAIGQEQIRRERLDAAVTAARSALELSNSQYAVGQVDFTDVIGAEQALLTYEDNLAQSQGTIATDLISLFKALGGGWTPAGASEPRKDDSHGR